MASAALSSRMLPEPLRITAFGSITNSYVAIGTPLAHPSRIIKWQNNTDGVVYVSWDGVNDHQYFAAHSFDLIDEGTNRGTNADEFCTAQGTQFYIKYVGSAPTTGAFTITSFYARPI